MIIICLNGNEKSGMAGWTDDIPKCVSYFISFPFLPGCVFYLVIRQKMDQGDWRNVIYFTILKVLVDGWMSVCI